jgi:hypothetical protein
MTAADIVGQVRISDVYCALTAVEPRRAGADRWRAPAVWRGGDGLSVSGDDSRGVWYDHVTQDHGGVIDLVVRAHGGTRQDALKWCANLVGVPLVDRPLSAGERAEWSRRQSQIERQLPIARCWKRAAIGMYEELLQDLKAQLFAPGTDVGAAEIRGATDRLAWLRRADGQALIDEHQWWRSRNGELTSAMTHVAMAYGRAEQRAVVAFLRSGGGWFDGGH